MAEETPPKLSRASGSIDAAAAAPGPHYFAVGCFTVVAGFGGGGMIGVLIAKIVGAATRCTSEAETGAPCNWFTFAVYGAIAGAVILPTISIWSLRRARRRTQNSERG